MQWSQRDGNERRATPVGTRLRVAGGPGGGSEADPARICGCGHGLGKAPQSVRADGGCRKGSGRKASHAVGRVRTLRALILAVVGIGSALTAPAQELKVDINNHNRPVAEGLQPGFTPWSTNTSWFAGGDVISNTFGSVTVILRRVGPEGTALQPGYWKEGVQSAVWDAKLVSDGIKVNGGDAGAQIEMRLIGLPAGNHTLLTYHNDWDNHGTTSVASLDIFVNGVLAAAGVPQTVRVTNNALASTAYLVFQVGEGEEAVILFRAATNPAAGIRNVYLNGFELNTVHPSRRATQPVPADQDEHVDADAGSVGLRWVGASGAVAHDLYIGTDSNAVRQATRQSPEYRGRLSEAQYELRPVSRLVAYYWRVDEVDASGAVTRGDVWMFRARRLAFPGAEGYGRFARGGRGGVVIKVTNLNDRGPGSLRDAIEGNYGPRTIVFDVGGLITLESDLIITQPCITVAGQTAPGKGICLRKHQFGLSGARDVVVRFLRVRVGDLSGETQNASGMAGVDHCIMDHCSISWGIDEGISTRGAKNFTLQRTIIAEALNIAGHDKYPPGTRHGYAASVGGDIGSLHHNLLAHNEGRNWSLAGGLDGAGRFAGRLDVFNNVVYNWRSRTTDGGAHQVNFVNNFYKPGPASRHFYILTAQYDNFPGTQQYYFVGNVMPGYFQTNQQEQARRATGYVPTNYSPWVTMPFFPSYATIDEVTNAYKKVLSDVGCNRPEIDDHDLRIIREVLDGTATYRGSISGDPGLPDSQNDVGGWEEYPVVNRPPDWDTDNDGLPNWWEEIHGLNPQSAPGDFSDANGDLDGDEFTNLEEYLDWLAHPQFDCTNGVPLEVDLTEFTRGFTNANPVYFVFEPQNGEVRLVGERRARFVSGVTTNALGGFGFAVVDAMGHAMTNRVHLRLWAGEAPVGPPRLTIRHRGGGLEIGVDGPVGRRVELEQSRDLRSWQAWTNWMSSGTAVIPLSGSDEGPRFFRAVVR